MDGEYIYVASVTHLVVKLAEYRSQKIVSIMYV